MKQGLSLWCCFHWLSGGGWELVQRTGVCLGLFLVCVDCRGWLTHATQQRVSATQREKSTLSVQSPSVQTSCPEQSFWLGGEKPWWSSSPVTCILVSQALFQELPNLKARQIMQLAPNHTVTPSGHRCRSPISWKIAEAKSQTAFPLSGRTQCPGSFTVSLFLLRCLGSLNGLRISDRVWHLKKRINWLHDGKRKW